MHLPLPSRLALPVLLLGTPAAAQTFCDQISVERIEYAPFGNGLDVVIHNGSDEFLSYPMVRLLDAQDDTLGNSMQFFFGILEHSSQVHHVILDAPAPTSPFSGTLLFHYSLTDSSGTCAIPLTEAVLCPLVACSPLQVHTYFNTDAPAGELNWTLTAADGGAVEQGTLVIDPAGPGSDADDVCLPPGEYTLHVSQTSMPRWEFPVTLIPPDFSSGDAVQGTLDPEGHLMLPFRFHERCVAIGQGVQAPDLPAPRIRMVDRQLHISTADDRPIGGIQVIDVMGRTVQQYRTESDRAVIDMRQHASGTYLVRGTDPMNPWRAQRILLP